MANVEAISDKTIIYDDRRWIDIGEYAPLKNRCRHLEDAVASLTSENTRLRKELDQWENPSSDSPNAKQRKVAALISQNEKYKQDLSNANDEISKLKSDNTALIKQHCLHDTSAIRWYEHEVPRVKDLLARKNEEIKDLKGQIADRDSTIEQLKEKLAAQDKTIEAQDKTIEAKDNTIKQQQEKIDAANDENKDLNLAKDALSDALAKAHAELNNDSSNSGISTGKTPIGKEKRVPPVNFRKKSDRKKGGQPGHPGNKLSRCIEAEITGTVDHLPADFLDQLNEDGSLPEILICPNCKKPLSADSLIVTEKDEIDFKVTVTKVRHRYFKIKCGSCGKEFRVKIPKELKEPAQYGPAIKTLICVLLKCGMVSVNRVQSIVNEFLNLEISTGYISKVAKKFGEMTKDFADEVGSLFPCFFLIAWDDTVMRAHGDNICFRTYLTSCLAKYTAHDKKDLESLVDDGILTMLTELHRVLHDHDSKNYNEMFKFLNAECNQHLLRDLEKVIQNNESCVWAQEFKDRLSSLIGKRNGLAKRNDQTEQKVMSLPEDTIKEFNAFLDKTLTEQDTIVSGLIEKHEKRQRELGNESKTINPPIGLVLQMRIINRFKNPKYREAYFAWMTDFRIPVTNNCSERAFRMEKTRMKVSGQFGSTENAQNHADAMTYLATCEKNGINCYKAIEAVFAGKPYTLEELGVYEHLDYPELRNAAGKARNAAGTSAEGSSSSEKPASKESVTAKPETREATAQKPAAKEATASKSESKEAAAPKPAAKEATAQKSESKEATAPKPATKEAITPKSAAKKATPPKSETRESTDETPAAKESTAAKPSVKDLQTATPPPGTGNQNEVNPVPERGSP